MREYSVQGDRLGHFDSLGGLLLAQAERFPDRPALCASDAVPLTYSDLWVRVRGLVHDLRRAGIGPEDRVAIVLPGGPELALTFLAGAAGAVAAPINPAYREEELQFHLADLRASAVVAPGGDEPAASKVARALGIPLLRYCDHRLVSERGHGAAGSHSGVELRGGDAPALLLHTSGTTSRPKLVPLSHANLCASAVHVRDTLALTPGDRCLNVMPLFHIHGLVAALLASLAAGAAVECAPGFYAPEFFRWMDGFRPTWYTAVPTMHQAILARAAKHSDVVARRRLRLIRSSSSALPPQVMAELEAVFGAPVIEAYGMTEAAHQMASNPLPPSPRKAGSVGRPAGPEIAIMDEAGSLLPATRTGEVVIRGPNVTRGYLDNADANRRAFAGGWFRTGDQGYLDPDGYLFITGRLKEIINRAGEKIAPRSVEEVLLSHPAVAEAAVFAVPDVSLGEAVGAAIVLRPGAGAGERELQHHVAARLADFNVPAVILVRDELPKGPTGKVQRIGLAARLGLGRLPARATGDGEFVAPRTPAEELVADLWAGVLGLERVGVLDHFLDLGGDSMLAARLVALVRAELGMDLPQRSLFDAPTVAEQAELVEGWLRERHPA
jgi:acyl-CoA synthetase (AMP-forming)/AMP-acid ligase II/acyl carrier protein